MDRQGHMQELMSSKQEIIHQLQKEILLLQGIKAPSADHIRIPGLGSIEKAFPNAVFARAVIHEFISETTEQSASGNGFIAALLAALMQSGGACMWISASRKLFPAALYAFGTAPERIIFADLQREKDILWAMEEALKCEGFAVVVAEVQDISFTQSRRLQLAVEQSKVTGFLLRNSTNKLNTTASAARWRISPLPSVPEDGMPGVGFPRWHIELLKVRNGQPGSWNMEWSANKFRTFTAEKTAIETNTSATKKTG